jgi:thioredoxin reductase (NADPH)
MPQKKPSTPASDKGKEKQAELFDLIIIGAGCVGYAAAMYAGRLEMKTMLIGEKPGGVITTTDVVENYPGFKRLTGQELIDKLREHALDYRKMLTLKENEKAVKIQKIGEKSPCWLVHTDEGNKFYAKTLLFATGSQWRKLSARGAKEFENKGVSYCALCDGAFFKDKVVCIVGGSDSAAKEALVMARYAKKVYIIYRGDEIHPEPVNYERIRKEPKIEIINMTNVVEVKGDKFVKAVVLDKPYKGKAELAMDGVFVSIGHIPLSDLAKAIGVKLNEKGEIIIDRASRTNVPGVFAAGDVVDTEFKQAITGVGEAVSAVYGAYKYVGERELVCA